jgi:hypothetical protein
MIYRNTNAKSRDFLPNGKRKTLETRKLNKITKRESFSLNMMLKIDKGLIRVYMTLYNVTIITFYQLT